MEIFQYILYINIGIKEYIEGKQKSKMNFRVDIFKIINITNAESIKSVNGGNNPKYNNNIQNINNTTASNNTRENIKAI